MAGVIKQTCFSIFALSRHSLLISKQPNKFQSASLVSKVFREKDYQRPPAFPYQTKKYGLIDSIFDNTTWRLDQNSKIIVVDGLFANGKAKFAKAVAEEFDLHYIRHANMDSICINGYGHDIRTLNHKLPLKLKTFDPHEFLENPNDIRSARLQIDFFKIRVEQYLDALSHLLNTGQGVIMNRSMYSDFVFLETYINMGYLPKTMKDYYYLLVDEVFSGLLRPHVIIYLDNTVEGVIENIKNRNNPIEIKSPVYQKNVLKELETVYKRQFLKQMSEHSEILIYDTTMPMDMDVVFDDLQMLNLDDIDKYEVKMQDWRLRKEWEWNEKRICYSRDKSRFLQKLESVHYFDCPELIYDGNDLALYDSVSPTLPGNEYAYGYNKNMGDSYLFKTN